METNFNRAKGFIKINIIIFAQNRRIAKYRRTATAGQKAKNN